METPGRIAATPDALDFTVENVEKVSLSEQQVVVRSVTVCKPPGGCELNNLPCFRRNKN